MEAAVNPVINFFKSLCVNVKAFFAGWTATWHKLFHAAPAVVPVPGIGKTQPSSGPSVPPAA